MKRLFFLMIFFVLPAITAWGEAERLPKINIPESSVTLKEAMEGETVKHEFTVLNEGNETLQIKAVRPG